MNPKAGSSSRVIGLLGGSFNPAHKGHLHISKHALKALGMDEVWWLVSPHNPLKAKNTLADYKTRLEGAQKITARERNIFVTDIEAKKNLRFTWQTVSYLQAHHPDVQFVWLMGADNLAGFHRWARWRWLLHAIPIVVFDRAPYSHRALRSKTYLYMSRFRAKKACYEAPSLHFVHLKRDATSATAIRKNLGK